jgi:secreted trypsin-like serine protease
MPRKDSTRSPYPSEQYASIGGGDSGGPLLTADGRFILGIVSWGRHTSDRVGVAEGVYNDVLGSESQTFLQDFFARYGL